MLVIYVPRTSKRAGVGVLSSYLLESLESVEIVVKLVVLAVSAL